MANMSYCMFENTFLDVRQCLRAMLEWDGTLAEFYENLSSEYERTGFDNLMSICNEITNQFELMKEA